MSYLNSPTHISVCWRRRCRFDRLTKIFPLRRYKRERQLNKVIFYTAVTSKRRRTKLYTFMRERDAVPRDMYNIVWSCLLFVPDHFKYIFISNTSISHNRFLIPHPLDGCFLLDYIINPGRCLIPSAARILFTIHGRACEYHLRLIGFYCDAYTFAVAFLLRA
jgi:hypothetical protein